MFYRSLNYRENASFKRRQKYVWETKKYNNNCRSCDSQRIYQRLCSLSKHTEVLLFPHTPDWVNLLSQALFLRLKVVFLRLELSRGTTIAAEIGQAVVDPESIGQVRDRPHTLSLPWHGIEYAIWRFQIERFTTMLYHALPLKRWRWDWASSSMNLNWNLNFFWRPLKIKKFSLF